jgi:D-sedoheptulose 7-phosphate isomerase
MTLADRVRRARRVYVIGNGGSFANAQHIQNDLEACGIRAHTLNPASLTASANDSGYEFVFSRWVVLHGEPGDLLIALSGSGKSKNILNAIDAAKLIGMDVACIFGSDMGHDMQCSEEHQIFLGHELMRALK